MTTIFGSVSQIMLFIDDKPSPAFFNAWYANTEFSSIAELQSICKLSGMSGIHYTVSEYPTADLAFPVAIWRPVLGLLASTPLLHWTVRSQYQSWGCNERLVKDLDCREGILQVLPGVVSSEEKLIFLIGWTLTNNALVLIKNTVLMQLFIILGDAKQVQQHYFISWSTSPAVAYSHVHRTKQHTAATTSHYFAVYTSCK